MLRRIALASLFCLSGLLLVSLAACSSSPHATAVIEASATAAILPSSTPLPPSPTPLLPTAPPPTTPPPSATSLPPVSPSATPISPSPTPTYILWDEAMAHVGETLTVCGPVMGTHFAQSSNGKPTFLNVGAAYPDPQRFTVLIWGSDRHKFPGPPEQIYLDQNICVHGEIEEYNGMAEIVVEDPAQIVVQE